MNRSDSDKLVDEIIGEAVITLLQAKGPVTSKALIDQLHSMEAQTSDNNRRNAIVAAIKEVRTGMASSRKLSNRDINERDTIRSLLSENKLPGNNRKH